jgi:hypothetical protein
MGPIQNKRQEKTFFSSNLFNIIKINLQKGKQKI